MTKETELTDQEVRVARERRLEAMHLQVIEDNPMTVENLAMFEMFERERWSFQRRIEHIRKLGKHLAGPPIGE